MESYFQEPGLITLGVLIVDARHKPTVDDVTMRNWFRETGCPLIVVANKLDTEAAQANLPRFVQETGVEPIGISCATREGLDAFKDALRACVNPKTKFHHTHADAPDLSEMPDTTGDEIPAEALKFATFLKLEKPKEKSHPSRGNIH